MARMSRGNGGRTLTKPISPGSKVTTGGKFDRTADPGDATFVDSNSESGPRLNPTQRGKLK